MPNPLLDFSTLPAFDRIRPAHIVPAIDVLLAQADAALQTVTAQDFPPRWQNLSAVLDVATERLAIAWGAASHLHSVADTPELRAAYTQALPKVTQFWTRLGTDARLYAKYQAVDAAALNPEQRAALEHTLRDFALSGARLQGPQRQRFAQIQERLAQLAQTFSENVLDATDAFAYYASAQEMAGVPADVQQAARAAAQEAGRDGYKLTLQMPCYLPVLQFADSSALREKLYRAYVTRASDQGDARQFDNSAAIAEILALRHEQAQLLGYRNFAEVSLATKMAESPAQVLDFVHRLAQRARPYAQREVAELRQFAHEHLQLDDPQSWDWAWASEKLKAARYAFNEQEVKQYFPAPRVLAGLFSTIETLLDVRITPDAAPVWHPSVQFYRLERNGQLLGQFYLDRQARTGKRGGAWMDDVRSRWLRPDSGQLQTPVAHLVCNFAADLPGQAALLTHDDVITLFHEAGHGLHHLLTQVNEHGVAGINGVEWDAVELPSQFMENFCWQWQVLQRMSAHVETGAPLPHALYDKMLAAKNFQAGMQTLRQIEFALLDMLAHSVPGPQDIMALLQQVRDEVAVLPAPAYSRTPHSFSHIFAGGYAAGYYSYKWAEVLSADAWAAFEETMQPDGTPNPATARRWCEHVLEAGGARPALESFKAFRGRAPQIDALLRHQGMVDSQVQ